jgi:hypothetical protein
MGAILVLLERRASELKSASLQAALDRAPPRRRDGDAVVALAFGSGPSGAPRARARTARTASTPSTMPLLDLYVPESLRRDAGGCGQGRRGGHDPRRGHEPRAGRRRRCCARLSTGLLSDVVELERAAEARFAGSGRSIPGKAYAGRPFPTPRPRWRRCGRTSFPPSRATGPAEVEASPRPTFPARARS